MLIVITGGSGSGKSVYAERRAQELSGGSPICYLATMQVYDEESRARVQRHRAQREGKGFYTVEQPLAIEKAVGQVQGGGVLLECMSNLVANEMFSGKPSQHTNTSVKDRILAGIRKLEHSAGWLIVVTNNVFEDGITYDASTQKYLETLGEINCELAAMADEVTEVVVGIPVKIRG